MIDANKARDVGQQMDIRAGSKIKTDLVSGDEAIGRIKKLEDPSVAQTPLIIGGGIVNAMVCAHVGADYWETDAMVGVQLCKQILKERKKKKSR